MSDIAMNKRQHIRILVALKVTATTKAGTIKALTKNLSVGGLYLLTDAKCEPGEEVQLRLEHKGAAVELRSTVTDARADGLGLSFIDPPQVAITELIGVIDDILSTGAGVDGGEDMLSLNPRLVMFRRGMLEYLGTLQNVSADEATIETGEVLRNGEPVLLLLPAQSEGAHVREIVGSFATVTAVTDAGFTAKLVDASDEFVESLARGTR